MEQVSNFPKDCNPTPARCVLWDGPNIPCLNLCKGDSIQDVVYKAAKELCKVLEGDFSLDSIDLKCLYSACESCPVPSKTLSSILQLLIDKVCNMQTAMICLGLTIPTNQTNTTDCAGLVTTLGLSSLPNTGGGTTMLALAPCLVYTDPLGNTVNYLSQSDYTQLLAKNICNLLTLTGNLQSTVSNMNVRLTTVETEITNISTPVPIYVNWVSCLGTSGTHDTVQNVVYALEVSYCSYLNVLDSVANISASIGKQMTGLAALSSLCNPSVTMGSLSGWSATPTTVANTLSNLWLTVNDLRCAVSNILSTCCAPSCSQFVLNFTVTFNSSRSTATLITYGLTNIPAGFTDSGSTNIVFIDSLGYSHTYTGINIVTLTANPSGQTFSIGSDGLSGAGSITAELSSTIGNGTLTCAKEQVYIYPASCILVPVSTTSVGAITTSSIVFSWIAPSGINPATLTGYKVCITDESSSPPVESCYTVSSSTLTYTFTGLTSAHHYLMDVTALYSCGVVDSSPYVTAMTSGG